MNVKELIEKIEVLPAEDYKYRPYIDKKMVLGLVRQLDEPEKVKIPQFVADAIEGARELSPELEDAFNYVWSSNERDFDEWYSKADNRKLFARAWIFGYEVEKEKRYTVTVKGDIKEKLLVYGKTVKRYFFTKDYDLYNVIYSHTRKQLEEANFGWVFSCEGVEIEEVE